MDKEELLEKLDELCKKYVNEYVTSIKDSLMIQLVGYLEDQKNNYEQTYGSITIDKDNQEQKVFAKPVIKEKEQVVHDIGGNEVRLVTTSSNN